LLSANRLLMENVKLHYTDLIGQTNAVARLKAFGEYFASTGGNPENVLLIGEDGMGQSRIALTFAHECGVPFQQVDAASLEMVGDLTALLTNLGPRQVLFMDNLQRLRGIHVDRLTESMRDGKLEIIIGKGTAARTHVMEVKPFTLIATCPTKSDCPAKLLDAFSLVLNLQPYSVEELCVLAIRIANGTGVSFQAGVAELIARCCDGRPRHLESTLLRLVRAINKTVITEADVLQALGAFGIAVRSDGSPSRPNNLGNLSGQDFERLITTLLTRMGFQAEMTKTTGDGGIDIIAMLDKPIYGGRYLFQCKRFAPDNLIGAPTVRDFYGAVTADRAVKGVFITTSDFTLQAREFGERVGVELINLPQLRKLFFEYGIAELQDG
jgi:Holliday junction resolvasome RuvABC ATP-dependent DNA helicase subunit